MEKENFGIFTTEWYQSNSDNRSLSISWIMFVNLTFYLHFGEETDPISQFNNNDIFDNNDNTYSIKEVTKNNNINIVLTVLINNDAVLGKTLHKCVYQKMCSVYIFIDTKRVDRKRCQDFSSKLF